VNPTAEEAFWRENYSKEPYYEQGRSFDDYSPAYRLGLSGRERYPETSGRASSRAWVPNGTTSAAIRR
jgi:hypothetical protein